ncbi:MAG: ATPase [Bacteroidales bacterium]|nr:ATPase [Bacteroidales bacterium]
MILIADSGSTNTDWLLIDKLKKTKKYQTSGLNPYFIDTNGIEKIISKELIPIVEQNSISAVYFYGAGCSTLYKCFIVEEALQNLFKNATIEINSDLLGAAISLFGNNNGIACILGTGSNSCYFDGKKIAENVPSLGYFFGDEGSGAHLGKTLIKAYLLNKVPVEIKNAFNKKYSYTRENILDAIYNLPKPNIFLASFSEFFLENISNNYIREIILNCFREFFSNQIKKYKNYKKIPIGFVGSIAYHFKDILKEVAEENNVSIQKVLKTPIEDLQGFHI